MEKTNYGKILDQNINSNLRNDILDMLENIADTYFKVNNKSKDDPENSVHYLLNTIYCIKCGAERIFLNYNHELELKDDRRENIYLKINFYNKKLLDYKETVESNLMYLTDIGLRYKCLKYLDPITKNKFIRCVNSLEKLDKKITTEELTKALRSLTNIDSGLVIFYESGNRFYDLSESDKIKIENDEFNIFSQFYGIEKNIEQLVSKYYTFYNLF